MRSQEQLEATQLKMLSLTPDVFNLESGEVRQNDSREKVLMSGA